MTEDFLERMRMADQDDDDADLKRLKQLRQVWLAMPDEEPPARGLDALMAAARTKAEEMQPRSSWWRRLLATMVRPPMLALATIVVVAGGAVLVHRHRDDLDATQAAPAAARDEGVVAIGAAAPSAGGERKEQEAAGSGAMASEDTAKSLDTTAAPTAAPAAPKPVPQVVHSATTATKKPTAPSPKLDAPKHDVADDIVEPKKIVLTPQDPRPTVKAPEPQPAPPPPPPADKPMAPPAPSATRAPSRNNGNGAQLATDNEVVQNQVESVDSMLKRAREAATRGDCPAAKAIAAQIARQDPGFFRSTAAKDPVLAKCL